MLVVNHYFHAVLKSDIDELRTVCNKLVQTFTEIDRMGKFYIKFVGVTKKK